ncbi:hypothetical protein SOHN41_01924 [Shewanella sp. HN-41]|nr:hypothetical protein SOHN41_01924 [Shewanella sp. HN-41]
MFTTAQRACLSTPSSPIKVRAIKMHSDEYYHYGGIYRAYPADLYGFGRDALVNLNTTPVLRWGG